MRRTVAALLVFTFLPAVARAQSNFHTDDIADVRHDDDPDDPKKPVTEVVVMSEGYTKANEALFWERAHQIAKSLREDQASSVMREVTTFHFTYVWVPSKDNGAPWRNGEEAGDTPFGAHITKDGSLATDDGAVDRAVKHVMPEGNTNRTVSVVLIHLLSKRADHAANAPKVKKEDDPNTGPSDVRDISDTPEDLFRSLGDRGHLGHSHGVEIGRVRQVDIDMRAFVHEFGHARFGLDDEYANDPDEVIPEKEKAGVAQFPNSSIDPTGARWKKLVPELFDGSGKIKQIFEGGSGYGKGVWHASHLCRMNQSRTEDFCPVCKAIIRGSIHDGELLPAPAWVSVKDAKDGSVALQWKAGSKEQPNSFHLALTDATGKVVWKTDVEGHVTSFDMPAPKPGPYTVSVTAQRVSIADPANVSKPAATKYFKGREAVVARDDHESTDKRPVGVDRGFSRTSGLSGKINERTRDAVDPDRDPKDR
ncbi:MAG TPA: M64 family metallopeptidase [Planctomycetota bacterium]|nr:M64 family metallopeptidase [Planctomycetota bacterium]